MTIRRLDHWINGTETSPALGQYFENRNPEDDSLYSSAADGSGSDIESAVESAHNCFQEYRRTLPMQREQWLLNSANLLQQQSERFIEVLINEIGSPVTKARKEISTAVGILTAAAGATRNLTGKTLPTDVPGRLSISLRQPLGVIAGITPFNVPLIKNIKHIAMPLATGNTVVLLPSEEAPVTAILVAKLLSEAGFPNGAINVVTGSGHKIGDHLTNHALVKMVAFTGSARVGRHVATLCGAAGKRFTLEMGGKNPLIVLKDADLPRAVQGSIPGSFLYQGQICMASSRIYVEEAVFDQFLAQFSAATANLSGKDLHDPKTMVGPIINERQRKRILVHLKDALAKGAKVETGGRWEGNRCEPTILTNVTPDMAISHEETFGPVTCVYRVATAEHALRQANDTDFGLSAAVYTQDLTLAMKFVEELRAGMVHINGSTIQDEPHVPFGGIGTSGFGRESTDVDIDAMTEWKWATIQHA